MTEKRKLQSISFNLSDPYERKLYDYATMQQKYFSRYVKRLIEKDMLKQEVQFSSNNLIKDVNFEASEEDREAVSGFL